MVKTFIEVIESPRPEDGKEPPLPTYHDLLEQICTRFELSGCPTFWEALQRIEQKITRAERRAKDMESARDYWKDRAGF